MSGAMRGACAVAALASLASPACGGRGRDEGPHTPARDDVVLAEVPRRAGDGELAGARALEARLRDAPRDPEAAAALARLYLEEGRRRADPRWAGRAEAVIAAACATELPAPELLVLRATLRQSRHDFAGAREDLDRAIAAQPTRAQAWVTRAVIDTVQGRYAEAERGCAAVARLSTRLVAATCWAGVASLTGRAEAAAQALERELAAASGASAGERQWALSTLAEIAVRRGDERAAERYFAEGLASGERDPYLLAARADLLLDTGRAAEARALLVGHDDVDALLLRLLIAEARLDHPEYAAHRETLAARYAAARARGEATHAREEARFALEIEGDAATALARAREAWAVQREPADARVFLEAALAAHDRAAAAPVLAHLAESRTEDRALSRLIAALEGGAR